VDIVGKMKRYKSPGVDISKLDSGGRGNTAFRDS
jgi:hypothetical protein